MTARKGAPSIGAVSALETVLPGRLGAPYRWLLASSWISNLGDGLMLAAGPLLVASQTHSPLLVALATLLQQLPTVLFGLLAGAIADRFDRRMIVVVADALRAAVIVILGMAVLTGQVSIAVLLLTLFVMGTAECFSESSSATLMPMVVDAADYGLANARLMGGFIVANQLAGPPIGAALFAIGMAVPFVTQAVCVGLGAALVTRMTLPAPPARERQHLGRDITEGLQWLWRSPPVRTLTLAIVAFNVTYGAAWSVLVLYALQRLHMGAVGFGLLTTASALGGLAGTACYTWLERRVSLADIMRGGLVIETFTHLALAVTTVPWVALGIFFVFGAHAFIWGTTSQTVRQRAVPREFQGRVGSVYRIGVLGGMVLGGVVGGVIAQRWGVVAPFWFAFVGSAVILVLIWRQLAHIAHVDEPAVGAVRTLPSTPPA